MEFELRRSGERERLGDGEMDMVVFEFLLRYPMTSYY